jgi:molybdopterin converting factor small subunit
LRISVKYAVPFRENVGVSEETYELQQVSATVAEVLELIARRHASIAKLVDTSSEEAQRHRFVVAVNSSLARLTDDLHDGDKLSLLLPVIGG